MSETLFDLPRHSSGGQGIRIPEDLVAAVRERRVIPFVGAGLSASLGSPDWETLLRRVCEGMGEDFDAAHNNSHNDLLQLAEYLYIKSDKRIGPIRHEIEKSLRSDLRPSTSTAHVELVNLGAPQIYTTNYDDLIERTYAELGIPSAVVALPKDVASFNNEKTQIVKYHGDLRHEETLVLTESAYYKRLDLESPMDLKFRSDILGRSVLFLGYSFRDVNIRLIWFKLMQMMQDISPSDRRTSYIVRVEPNPLQDALFRDVGLTPITLDPTGRAETSEQKSLLLGRFLENLAARAGHNKVPGRQARMYTSSSLLKQLQSELNNAPSGREARYLPYAPGLTRRLQAALVRKVPEALKESASGAFRALLNMRSPLPEDVPYVSEKANLFGPSQELLEWTCRTLAGGSEATHEIRASLVADDTFPWNVAWQGEWSNEFFVAMARKLVEELAWQSSDHASDADLLYLYDLTSRALRGDFGDPHRYDEKVRARVERTLEKAEVIYPALRESASAPDQGPTLHQALAQLQERHERLVAEGKDGDEEDFAFFVDEDEDLVEIEEVATPRTD